MCGFIASFGFEFKKDDFKDALEHLARRGPDSEGIWSDKDIVIAFVTGIVFGVVVGLLI